MPLRRRIALGELLARVRPVLARRAEASGTRLAVDDAAAGEAQVETDPELVERVLYNLVDNACKYASEAEDPVIRLRVQRRDDRVLLFVEDRGPGIPAELTRSIFEPWERGALAPDDARPGVGLGLALSRGDVLLLHTDGVNEATDANGEEFGLERLRTTLQAAAPRGAQAVVDDLEAAVKAFVGEVPQNDDITLIAIEKR